MPRDELLLAVGAVGGVAAVAAAISLLRSTAARETIYRPAERESARALSDSTTCSCWLLRRSQEILLPSNINGRLDHFAFDAANQILYLACLGSNAVLEIDTFAGVVLRKWGVYPHAPRGHPMEVLLDRPQGVLFVPTTKNLYVANAGDGVVHILNTQAGSGETIAFGDEADNLRFEDGVVYVGYGNGAVGAIVDGEQPYRSSAIVSKRRTTSEQDEDTFSDWVCDEHPEGFQLDGAFLAIHSVAHLGSLTEICVQAWVEKCS